MLFAEPTISPGLEAPSGTPDAVFARIALSLSGGGFRASAYGLGTLNILYLLGLLDQVQMLSTASGGTLTGAFYALRRKQGDAFEKIYADGYQWLEQDSLLPDAVAHWQQTIASGGDCKLIRAFADTYDRTYYNGATLADFWQPDPEGEKPFHLQSIIFGATELYSGLTFRFQHAAFLPTRYQDEDEGTRDGYFLGNGNVRIDLDHARSLRLADMVAASSCFPGGFEPLIMPDDFFPDQATRPILLDRNGGPLKQQRISLIDGGVYDNQGIESLLAANKRNRAYCRSRSFANHELSQAQADLLQPSTLFVIADVDSAAKDLHQPPGPPPPGRQSLSLGKLEGWLGGALLLVSLLLVVAVWLSGQGSGSFGAGLLAGVLLPVLALLVLARWGWGKLKLVLVAQHQTIVTLAWPSFMQLSLRQWGYLLMVRLSSLFALLNSVFLRRVRSLNYGQLYSGPSAVAFEVLPSIIGGIVNEAERPHQPNSLSPSVRDQLTRIVDIVWEASQMPTTLWWQADKYRLPKIVASAEITFCYRLLLLFEKKPPAGPSGREIRRRAQLVWDAYQLSPADFRLYPVLLSTLQSKTCTAEQLVQASAQLAAYSGPVSSNRSGHL